MATYLMRPLVAEFLDTFVHSDKLELFLEEIAVGKHSPLVNMTLLEARQNTASSATILASKKMSEEFVTDVADKTVIKVGDKMVAIGTRSQLRALEGLTVEA